MSLVLPQTYRACFVSSKLKKKEIYSIVLLNYRYCFVCYERSEGNMEKRACHDVLANGNTFASVFLATGSSILQCFLVYIILFFSSCEERDIVHAWNGHLEMFSLPQTIENSRQFLFLRFTFVRLSMA